LLELDSELSNLLLEVKKLFLDISSLLILKRENGLLNWSKSLLADFNELSLAVLKLDEEVLLHLNTMLLEKHDSLLHGLNLFKSAILVSEQTPFAVRAIQFLNKSGTGL
jgi:hypothetical protein